MRRFLAIMKWPPEFLLPLDERFSYLVEALRMVQSGEIHADSLRRQLWLSNIAHQTLNDTITQSLEEISELRGTVSIDPALLDKPLQKIAECNMMLQISNDKISKNTFPFQQLPGEIRSIIHRMTLLEERDDAHGNYKVNWGIMEVNKQIRSETVPIFYSCNKLVISGTPNLLAATQNICFQLFATSINLIWKGDAADLAFSALEKCVSLEALKITVTKDCLEHKTVTEEERLKLVPGTRTRLLDALGVRELMALRGFRKVSIQNLTFLISEGINRRVPRRWERELIALDKLLKSRLLRSRWLS